MNHFQFIKFNQKQGKYGKVGTCYYKNKECVFKYSKHINYNSILEYNTMCSLSTLCSPHFCKAFGYEEIFLNPSKKKIENPFNNSHKIKYPIPCVFMEKIIGKSLTKMINSNITDPELFNTINQIMLAISEAQEVLKFTHYDLHSDNILITKTDISIHAYIFPDNQIYTVETYGLCPVIIDFGFSYIQDLNNKPLYASLSHTDCGFTSYTSDSISDSVLFLLSISYYIEKKRNSEFSKHFINKIYLMFDKLPFQKSTGWLNYEYVNATKEIVKELPKINMRKTSIFSEENIFYTMNILQGLVTIPFKNINYKLFDKAYLNFLSEWLIIENALGNGFRELFVLKILIDGVKKFKNQYLTDHIKTTSEFKNYIFSKAPFIKKVNCNYELIICSLFIIGKKIEHIFYRVSETNKKLRENIFLNFDFQSSRKIYEELLKFPIIFQKEMKIRFFNWDGNNKDFIISSNEDENDLNYNTEKTLLKIYHSI